MDNLKKTFWAWFPLGASITLLSLTIYGTAYQAVRSLANDPQIQIAEDSSASLNTTGRLPGYVNVNEKTDIEKSLAPFVIVYSLSHKPLFGNGFLRGQLPKPPDGVFASAMETGQNRLTWQPAPSIRIAMVLQPYNDGFVLSGRSLREVEKRMLALGALIFIGWLFTMVLTFAVRLISFEGD